MSEQRIHLDQMGPQERELFFRRQSDDLEPGEELVILFKEDPALLLKSFMEQESERFSYEMEKTGTQEWKVKIKRKKESCCGFCGGE